MFILRNEFVELIAYAHATTNQNCEVIFVRFFLPLLYSCWKKMSFTIFKNKTKKMFSIVTVLLALFTRHIFSNDHFGHIFFFFTTRPKETERWHNRTQVDQVQAKNHFLATPNRNRYAIIFAVQFFVVFSCGSLTLSLSLHTLFVCLHFKCQWWFPCWTEFLSNGQSFYRRYN